MWWDTILQQQQKKEQTVDTCSNMNEPQKYYAQ